MNATMYMISKEKLKLANKNDSVKQTLETMEEGNFKTLPVVDEAGQFIGVIRSSDLYKSFFHSDVDKETFYKASIYQLVDESVKPINKNTDFAQVILNMEKMDIHFLACVDDYNRFLGIVTRNNIFQAFESAFGLNQDGYMIEVIAIDAKGQLARLAQAISAMKANIISIIQFDLTVANLERIIVKVQADNIDRVLEKISDEGFRITHHRFVPKHDRNS